MDLERRQCGKTIDFLLTAHGDEPTARTFLTKAIRRRGVCPRRFTIDGSAAGSCYDPAFSSPP
jgi:transposase-like protein